MSNPKSDPLVASYYKDIAKKQVFLSTEEEHRLFEEYRRLRKSLQDTLLSSDEALQELTRRYYDLVADNRSIAKLARSFNSKKKGHNKKVIEQIHSAAKSGAWDSVSLSYNVCIDIYSEIKDTDSALDAKIKNIVKRLDSIQQIISNSMLQAAVAIAHKYASNVFGIEQKDAIQEANRGIIESIENYDPNKPARFLTYAYNNAISKVREFIMNQSRLVRLPRNQLDRIFIVIEASNRVINHEDAVELTYKSNQILSEKKGRLLNQNEIITEDEVIEAITFLNSNAMPLESPNSFTANEASRPRTIGDLLPDEGLTIDQEYEKQDSRNELVRLVKKHLNELEFCIIYYKYLAEGDERSLEDVQVNVEQQTGRKLSRQRINQIKKIALKKLRKDSILEYLR